MRNVSSRLMKGSVWLSASRVIVNALSLLSTLVLARLLVPEDFGIVSLATTILVIVMSVTELSLSLALVRHESVTDEHLNTAWTLNALRGLVLAVLFA
ncbi:MAG: oligosaccharide flippase family protein, partial [Steroidobacteraceae bacterium]